MKESTVISELASKVEYWPIDTESARSLDTPINCEWSEKDGEVVLLLSQQSGGFVTKKDWQQCISMNALAAQRGMANPDRVYA